MSDSIPPTVTVTQPTGTSSANPTYTTSSSYTVKGTVVDDSDISYVTVNDIPTTVSGTSWSLAITLTANTTTTLTIVAVDSVGNKTTVTRYIRYDSDAPSLTVTAPTSTNSSSPIYTSLASYTVSGTVSDASGIASVTVNGSAATISGNNWSKSLSLSANTTTTVTIVATDKAGRTTSATRYVYLVTSANADEALKLSVGVPCTLLKFNHATDPGGVAAAVNWNLPWSNSNVVGFSSTPANMKYSSDQTYLNSLRTASTVNLTPYSKINFNISMENTEYFDGSELQIYGCILTSASSSSMVKYIEWTDDWNTHNRNTRYSFSLDISSITGSYIVCVRIQGSGSESDMFTIWVNQCTLS